jgi:hypothetical protein
MRTRIWCRRRKFDKLSCFRIDLSYLGSAHLCKSDVVLLSLSITSSCGCDDGVGTLNSLNWSVFGSNLAILFASISVNQTKPVLLSTTMLSCRAEFEVGVFHSFIAILVVFVVGI